MSFVNARGMGCQSSKYKLNQGSNKIFIGQQPRKEEFCEVQQFNFNDLEVMSNEGQQFRKIYAIKVQIAPSYINGIQVAYEVANGTIITGKNHIVTPIKQKKRKNKNFREDVFEIKGDDYITQISGSLGKRTPPLQSESPGEDESHLMDAAI